MRSRAGDDLTVMQGGEMYSGTSGLGGRPRHYRITLRGELGQRFEAEFEGMDLESGGGKTFLLGTVDQSQLHGILERIHEFNLEIIEVEELSESDAKQATEKSEER